MKDAIAAYLGAGRLETLALRFGGAAVLADEIELAALAAGRRDMTAAQRVVFAAISTLRRAGVRPAEEDIRAWQAAGAAAPAAKKPRPRSKRRPRP